MRIANNNLTRKINAQMCAAILIMTLLAGAALGPLTRALAQENSAPSASDSAAAARKAGYPIDKKDQEPDSTDQVFLPSPDLVTATTYPFTSTSAIPLEDMSSGTTQLVGSGLDDNNSAVTNIGFDYWFDGVRATQFSANANGLLRLGSTQVSQGFTNGLATTTDAPKIGAYWDDLCTGTNGKVHYKVVGSAPNRKLVVEWQNMQITRGAGCAGAGNGTFQVWLFETTGVIQFVYGTIQAAAAADGGYSVGFQSGAATNFASVTTSSNSVSYATANDTQLTAITAGTSYLFTPNVPAAPTGLNFTAVSQTGMTLNWTDNATNEVGYAIYQSTDNVNFTFVTQTAANATSQVVGGLNPSTNYFFRVLAVTEGAVSTALTGSQATIAPGNVTSIASGNWSAGATWSGGVPPTSGDNVTIQSGHTVTIDSSNALNVTVQSGGILQFEQTTARTLTVGQAVTINSGGTFQSNPAGTQTGHVLSVGTDLTNNGTLDFSTNGNTAGAGITFTGATNNTFGGTGATTDIRTLTVNKGTSNANILELNPSNLTVQGTTVDGAPMAFLTLTNGTLKISGTFAMTGRVFTTAAYLIGTTTGFWLNNPNFTVAGQGSSPSTSGLLRISQGTFNIGTATGNSMAFNAASTTIVEGGAVNAAGRFGVAASGTAVNYTQSGGTVTVCTIGNASTTLASFDLGISTSTVVNISGGTIIIRLANTGGSGPRDYRFDGGNGPAGLTGGTVQFGDAGSGAAKAFNIRGNVPNLVIDSTSAAHSATFDNTLTNFFDTSLNITINTGATLNLNGSATSTLFFMQGATLTNNGILTATNVNKRLYWSGTTAQTYTGTGTVTAPLNSFDVDNALGVTLTSTNQVPVSRIILFTGGISGANKLTLGNGGATTGTIQIGNTSAGSPTAAGVFDVPLTFNLGTGGEVISYLRTTTSRTTGGEINPTRTLTTLTYDDNDPAHTLTIAGGDITVTGTTSLTNGRVVTGANNLIIGGAGTVARTTGYVDGNLRKTYAAAGSKTFEVGTANGYSPAQVNNATAGAFPATMTVAAVQGAHPSVNAATSIQRYWTLTNGGLSSADLVFTYLPTDPLGNEAAYRVIRIIGGIAVSFPTSTVNAGTDTATLTGVTTFSDWTVGENSAPTSAPASISGLVTDANGQPMGGVVLNLSGGKSGRAITDGAGRYSFSNLETNSLYIISPLMTNFNFNPSSRTYSLVADRTDASFSGTVDSIPVGNPVDTEMFFVRQNYIDFLGREPDVDGLNYWTGQIEQCGGDAACINSRRIDVSAAFFKESEFQDSGSYIYRLYRGALGRQLNYAEFSNDRKGVVGGANLEQSKVAFADAFVQRPEFIEKYSSAQTAESFVSNLIDTMRESAGVDLSGQYNTLLSRYQAGSSINQSRSLVVREAIEAASFKDAVYNHSFVLMEYYGYLKRDPDQAGLDFWINVLNNREPNNYRGMVCSFLTSAEYQKRFSSVVTHSNAECGQ